MGGTGRGFCFRSNHQRGRPPNTPNQTVQLSITGGDQVAGEDFFAQIGDGGSFNGGINTGPVFSGVDILAGSIFAGNNTGAVGDPDPGGNAAHPLIWLDSTTTSAGTVSASGLLATLTIDTTGISSGTYPLTLTGVASAFGPFDTTLRDSLGDPVALNVLNGTITVAVPEPSTWVLLSAAYCVLIGWSLRRPELA